MSLKSYNPVDWNMLRFLKETDFQYPDRMDKSVVLALDFLCFQVHAIPKIISDYRFPETASTSQHGLGRAIDFTIPGSDSLQILGIIEKSKLFSGYGMYTNEKGVESFHVDTRTTRTRSNPATWGAWKDASKGITSWQYVGLANIVAKISKGAGLAVVILVGIALYVLTNK